MIRNVRVEVERRIGADPSSTALLLAGPSAVDLWPGVERIVQADGKGFVEAELRLVPPAADGKPLRTAASITARPPKRTPTSFVTSFTWSGADLPGTTGELTLTYGPAAAGPEDATVPSTDARLVLDAAGLEDSPLDADALQEMAEGFLANLATVAEERRAA